MKNPLWKTLALPGVLACLSAYSPAPDHKWSYGPFVEGEHGNIYLRYRQPSVSGTYFFCDVTDLTDPSWRYVVNGETKSMPKDDNGYYVGFTQVPGKYLKKDHMLRIYMGLSKKKYTPESDWGNHLIFIMDEHLVQKETNLFVFDSDGSYDSERETIAYDPAVDPDMARAYTDGYNVSGIRPSQNLSGRKLPLRDLKIEYVNAVHKPSSYPTAQLRISTYKDDFFRRGVDYGGYVSFALDVSIKTKSNGVYLYEIRGLRQGFHYSMVDYRMNWTEPANEPSFYSTDFYFPLREGHDTGLYQYQIVIENAGKHGDTVIVRSSAYSSKSLFGPCHSADYCVVIGG